MPDAGLGIALLNNLDRGFMNLALSNTLIDTVLGLPRRDWNAYYLDIQTKEDTLAQEQKQAVRGLAQSGRQAGAAAGGLSGQV